MVRVLTEVQAINQFILRSLSISEHLLFGSQKVLLAGMGHGVILPVEDAPVIRVISFIFQTWRAQLHPWGRTRDTLYFHSTVLFYLEEILGRR